MTEFLNENVGDAIVENMENLKEETLSDKIEYLPETIKFDDEVITVGNIKRFIQRLKINLRGTRGFIFACNHPDIISGKHNIDFGKEIIDEINELAGPKLVDSPTKEVRTGEKLKNEK